MAIANRLKEAGMVRALLGGFSDAARVEGRIAARQALSRACRLAKIPNYTPHDLWHRRITLWHQSGVPARELAERAGHSKPSMSLDVYTHVMPVGEVTEERYAAVLV